MPAAGATRAADIVFGQVVSEQAGSQPTRASVLAAVSTLGEYNLSDFSMNYSPAARKGWGGVDLSIINASGSLKK